MLFCCTGAFCFVRLAPELPCERHLVLLTQGKLELEGYFTLPRVPVTSSWEYMTFNAYRTGVLP